MKLKLAFTFMIVMIVLLQCVQVYLSNRIAGTSIEVARLRQDIEALDEKNTSLKTQLLAHSSFTSVASRAAEIGFTETKNNVILLKAPLPVAVSDL